MSQKMEAEMSEKSKMDKKKFETSISELKTKTFVSPADMVNYGKNYFLPFSGLNLFKQNHLY